ncbi:MAG: hypothetical protein MR494_01550 [Spirochaetia bacterium]|nr:hypothetical protein [Spirochaetia bacterium]
MYLLKPTHYKAVVKNYRNFPDLTVTITPVTPEDELRDDIVYTAESDNVIWTPGNPIAPYRHNGYGKSIEEATENALKTFSQDSKHFPNDQVFITSAKSDYKNATFIDGNGNEHTYQEAQKIISQNIKF